MPNHINEFSQIIAEPVAGWRSSKRPSNSTLTGTNCVLEPLDPKLHAKPLFEALGVNNRGESWTYLSYGPFASHEEFESWLVSKSLTNDLFMYAVVDPRSRGVLGMVSYMRIVPENGTIEIGHVHFSYGLKRSTAATQAVYLMMKNAFEELGYRRCEWRCNSLNTASRNAALRFGFTLEGIMRQDMVAKHRNRDTALFSVIDTEWPPLRVRFEKWLDPKNFDRDGKQVLSLRDV